MSKQSFIEALDQALELLDQGYPFEYCVRQFPEHADRLRPLLQVGDDLRRLAHASEVSLDKARGDRVDPDWETLLADIPQDHPGRIHAVAATVASRWRGWFRYTPQHYALLAASLLFLCMVTWHVTLTSPPNTPLYALKPAAESLQRAMVSFNPIKQNELLITHARQRLNDIAYVAQTGQTPPPQMIQQALSQAQAAVIAVKQSGTQPQLYLHFELLSEELQSTEQLIDDQITPWTSAPEQALFNSVDTRIEQLHSDLQDLTEEVLETPASALAAPTALASTTRAATSTVEPTVLTNRRSAQEDERTILLKEKLRMVSKSPTAGSPEDAPTTLLASQLPTVTAEAVVTSEPMNKSADESVEVLSDEPTTVSTSTPTSVASSEPTNKPAGVSASTPTETSTSTPTSTSTATSTSTPTSTSTATSTSTPTSSPTAAPTNTPTATPTSMRANTPTAVLTNLATATPISEPTMEATPKPMSEPTPTVPVPPTEQSLAEPSATAINLPVEAPTSASSSATSTELTASSTEPTAESTGSLISDTNLEQSLTDSAVPDLPLTDPSAEQFLAESPATITSSLTEPSSDSVVLESLLNAPAAETESSVAAMKSKDTPKTANKGTPKKPSKANLPASGQDQHQTEP